MLHYLLINDFNSIWIQFIIIFISWLIVILAIGIDLYFGIKKSKKQGVFTHSYGLRKTSEKAVDYSSLMFFMMFLDFLNPLFAYLDIVTLPLLSIFGAIFLVYTEWKSVKEKVGEKFRYAIKHNPGEILKLINENRELIEELKNLKRKE